MRYFLVFATEAEAAVDEQVIFARGAIVAQQNGYTVDAEGIVGKTDGLDDPDAGRTERWDIPRQRLDGKWVIAHPNQHPAAQNPETGAGYLAFVMQGITASAEVETADWWPAPKYEEPCDAASSAS